MFLTDFFSIYYIKQRGLIQQESSFWLYFITSPYYSLAFQIFYFIYIFSQRAGAVFPQRSERAAPVFTPPQTQPLSSYPPNMRNSDARPDAAEPSAESEFPSLRCIYRYSCMNPSQLKLFL